MAKLVTVDRIVKTYMKIQFRIFLSFFFLLYFRCIMEEQLRLPVCARAGTSE